MNQAPNNFREFLREFEESVLEIARITDSLINSEGGGYEETILREITSDDYNDENIANNIISDNPNSQDIVDSENNVQQ